MVTSSSNSGLRKHPEHYPNSRAHPPILLVFMIYYNISKTVFSLPFKLTNRILRPQYHTLSYKPSKTH